MLGRMSELWLEFILSIKFEVAGDAKVT